MTTKDMIQSLVDKETEAWNKQDVHMLISLFHPDMVWAWPPTPHAHDPADWILEWGRFDEKRWSDGWQQLFDTHHLIKNERKSISIKLTEQEDGALAVVDVETLWRNKSTGEDFLWKGRAGKIYTKLTNGEWKLIAHTGLLEY